ncbi:MAG: TIGR04552 family protein [Bdellovibrionota bacterium]
MIRKGSSSIFRSKYDFRWDVLDVIISGKSSIDSSVGFLIQTSDEAGRFIESYGYDLENPIERAEVLGNFHEALDFVRKYFLHPENPDGLKLEIPRKVMELTDIRELFLMASLYFPSQTADINGQLLKMWACSLLKVMHTIAHMDKDLRTPYFSDIQKQIFDRFYKVIYRDAEGALFMGEKDNDPVRIGLVAFETKPKKARDSIILKLLHKPENVAEDIFDRVGIRFVTETVLGAIQVVKYLKDKMIVMPPNIKPSRSRNTLVDLDEFRAKLADILPQLERGEIEESAFLTMLNEATHPPRVNPENPHSSEFYRAIQFTCRQLIKLRNPIYDDLKDLKQLARFKQTGPDMGHDNILKAIDKMEMKHLQREVRFFYPYEVQVMDRHCAEENERGWSAHSEYKKAQVNTALRRVMGGLVDVAR